MPRKLVSYEHEMLCIKYRSIMLFIIKKNDQHQSQTSIEEERGKRKSRITSFILCKTFDFDAIQFFRQWLIRIGPRRKSIEILVPKRRLIGQFSLIFTSL